MRSKGSRWGWGKPRGPQAMGSMFGRTLKPSACSSPCKSAMARFYSGTLLRCTLRLSGEPIWIKSPPEQLMAVKKIPQRIHYWWWWQCSRPPSSQAARSAAEPRAFPSWPVRLSSQRICCQRDAPAGVWPGSTLRSFFAFTKSLRFRP
jgi:hypothetical protein